MQETVIQIPGMLHIEICKNDFGTSFTKFPLLMNDQIHYAIAYRCHFCNTCLLSKNGARKHCCIQFMMKQSTDDKNISNQKIIEHILRYVASSNIPFRSIDNDFLRETFKLFDPNFEYPKKDKLLQELVALSKNIKQNMLNEIRGKKVSILVDGCKRWGSDYQAAIIYTTSRLYLFTIKIVKDSSAKSIADFISKISQKIFKNHSSLISVCTDNFSSNKKVLNGDEESVQKMINKHIIREPCSAHSGNLAIDDMFSNDAEYGCVVNEVQILVNKPPEGSFREGFHPRLKTIRWKSLKKCVDFICINMDKYLQSTSSIIKNSLEKIETLFGWNNLNKMLTIMWNFIAQVERDLASIAQIVLPFLESLFQLIDMNLKSSLKLADYLIDRFTSTCPFKLPLLAFILTPSGLRFFRTNNLNSNDQIFDATNSAIFEYMFERGFGPQEILNVQASFNKYLSEFDINDFNTAPEPLNLWDFPLRINFKYEFYYGFSVLASEVLRIPSSGAAVERVFSSLSRITMCQMCNREEESIKARLIVKFDSIFQKAGAINWVDLANNTENELKLLNY